MTGTRVPGPGQLASSRLLTRFFDDPHAFYASVRDRWGDVAAVRSGPVRMVVVHDLDLVHDLLVRQARSFVKGSGIRVLQCIMGHGLFTADGELHRRHRRLAAPAFQPRNLAPYAPIMTASARSVVDAWGDDTIINMHFSMIDVSLGIAGEAMFGYEFSDDERAAIERAVAGVNRAYRWLVTPGANLLARLPLPVPALRMLRRGKRDVAHVVHDMIAAGRERPAARQLDLLARFLAARDEDDGTSFTDRELYDEAVTLLFAGHETVAGALAWIFAMIGSHADIAQNVYEEIDSVLGGAAPDAETVTQLPYLQAVISETMRLRPSVYSFVREPIDAVDIGGFTVRRGTDVAIPICSIHRDPRHWPEPDEFRPERFLNEPATGERHRLAFMPFGAGPRICIGSGFAWLQLACVVATVLQRWSVELAPGYTLTTSTMFTQVPGDGLPMRVRRRRARYDADMEQQR